MTLNSIYRKKGAYFWHTVATAASSFTGNCTVNWRPCVAFVKRLKTLLSGAGNWDLVRLSTQGRNHKIKIIYKMGWTHLCSSLSKRWVEPAPTSKRSRLIILAFCRGISVMISFANRNEDEGFMAHKKFKRQKNQNLCLCHSSLMTSKLQHVLKAK